MTKRKRVEGTREKMITINAMDLPGVRIRIEGREMVGMGAKGVIRVTIETEGNTIVEIGIIIGNMIGGMFVIGAIIITMKMRTMGRGEFDFSYYKV